MTDPKLTPREPSEAERLAQALERDGKGFSATLGFTPACMPQAAAELRRLAALSESNAIDALNYESRIERLQAENDALRAMHDAAPKVEAEPVAFMWQHDETGRTGFCSRFDLENGFESNNPRLKIVGPLYTHPASMNQELLDALEMAQRYVGGEGTEEEIEQVSAAIARAKGQA